MAWINCLARGAALGRSLVYLAEHATRRDKDRLGPGLEAVSAPTLPAAVGPELFPGWLLNRASMRAFNELYFRRGAAHQGEQRLVHWDPTSSRSTRSPTGTGCYGRRGFVQYQCVIPQGRARAVLAEILDRVSRRGDASFLAVLKQLGEGGGPMSFPLRGYTPDNGFPRHCYAVRVPRPARCAGGRRRRAAYLARDARQSRATFRSGYPGLAALREIRQQTRREYAPCILPFSTAWNLMTGTRSILVIGGSSDIGHATALRYAKEGLARDARRPRSRGGPAQCGRYRDAKRRRNVGPGAGCAARPGNLPASSPPFPRFPTPLCVSSESSAISCGPDRPRARDDDHAHELRGAQPAARAVRASLRDTRLREPLSGPARSPAITGRASNYYYGAAKAGFSQFLSGLRNRLALAGKVRVVTVKPGFVRTKMTAHRKLPAPLTVDPDRVAEDIFRADVTKPRDVIYVARRFQLVMAVICALPGGDLQADAHLDLSGVAAADRAPLPRSAA